MLIYHSNVNLDVKILFDRVIHYLGPEVRHILIRGLYGNEDFKFGSGP